MKTHKKFIVHTIPFNVELVSGILWELDIEGINEEETFLEIFASEKSSVTAAEVEELLQRLKSNNLIETYNLLEESIAEVNWNEDWEKTINVIEVGNKFVIKPTFRKYDPKPDQIVLHIDPKMSFGTGEHETTKLILMILENIDLKNKFVLDAGSGTAVLAIAAAKLGASKVIAFDNDEWCRENGEENVELNSVGNNVDVRLASIEQIDEENFDVILANINKNILKDIRTELIERLVAGGTLILSGLLNEDENEMIEFYSNEMECLRVEKLGEWIALIFKKY